MISSFFITDDNENLVFKEERSFYYKNKHITSITKFMENVCEISKKEGVYFTSSHILGLVTKEGVIHCSLPLEMKDGVIRN